MKFAVIVLAASVSGCGGSPRNRSTKIDVPSRGDPVLVAGQSAEDLFEVSPEYDYSAQQDVIRVWHWNGFYWTSVPAAIRPASGPVSSSYLKVALAGPNTIWIAISNLVARVDSLGEVRDFSPQGPIVWDPHGLATGGGQTYLVRTGSSQQEEVFRFDGSSFVQMPSAPATVIRMTVDATGTPWLVVQGFHLFRLQAGAWVDVSLPANAAFDATDQLELYADNSRTLLLASSGGAVMGRNGTLSHGWQLAVANGGAWQLQNVPLPAELMVSAGQQYMAVGIFPGTGNQVRMIGLYDNNLETDLVVHEWDGTALSGPTVLYRNAFSTLAAADTPRVVQLGDGTCAAVVGESIFLGCE